MTRSARIVAHYYDRFPTATLRVRVVPEDGGGVRSGKTFGYKGGFIRVQVGREVTEDQLNNDWVLVHEMTHLALPDIGDDHSGCRKDWRSMLKVSRACRRATARSRMSGPRRSTPCRGTAATRRSRPRSHA